MQLKQSIRMKAHWYFENGQLLEADGLKQAFMVRGII
jgi:hypothetical protein